MKLKDDQECLTLQAVNDIGNIASKHIKNIFDAHTSEDMAIRLCYAFLETITAELISRALMIDDDESKHERFKARIINAAYMMKGAKLNLNVNMNLT